MVLTKKAVESEAQILKFEKLLKEININYKNISNYILSFIHRSIVNERPDYAPEHNERLEFLGDAVLELVITEKLFLDFPEKTEGELTDIRSALVRGKNLAKIAKSLNFSDYLLLGKGEEKGGGRTNDYLLANVVEAFIGALYLDLGFTVAEKFILENIYSTLDEILKENSIKEFKTLIQELAQADFNVTPTYEVISETGADHEKNFTVGIYFNKELKATGNGSSKKKAQEDAAKNLYLELTKS